MLWWTLRQLKSSNGLKRERAIENLRAAKDVRAVEPLIGTLTDSASSVRKSVIHALVQIGDHRAIEAIVKTLSDSDGSVRRAAAEALDAFGWQPVDDSHRAMLAVAQEKWDVATSIGESAIEPLMIALRDEGNIRTAAAESLGKMGDVTVEPLAVLLSDKLVSIRIREVAEKVLQQVGTSEARRALEKHRRGEEEEQRKQLKEYLQQEVSKVRSRLRLEKISYQAASDVLAKYSDYTPVPSGKNDDILTLEQMLLGLEGALLELEDLIQTGEPSPQVRSKASLTALAELFTPLSGEASLPALIKALEDGDDQVRRDAALTLIPALIQSLKSEATMVQIKALAILKKMGAEAKPAIPALLEAMKSANLIIHDGATNVLVALALPKSVSDEYMIETLERLCRAYAADDRNQIGSLESEARRIGNYLNGRGGISEMRRFFNLVDYEQGKRTLEMHWNGIGEWRG